MGKDVKKKMVNRYRYDKIYSIDKTGEKPVVVSINSNLYACHKNRDYFTKMTLENLPEYYCDVQRYSSNHDVISAKGIVDMKYTWVKENHFMKDSVLRISYTGKIEPYHNKWIWKGKEMIDPLISYTNEDELVFDNSIFKFLAYAHKYSKWDLTEIRNQFIEQCNWLSENEPPYAPTLDNAKDYGEWFDNIIKEY